MMSETLKEDIIDFLQTCDTYKNQTLHIKSYLSTHKNSLDRHFTSYTHLSFKMTNFGVRFSGNRAMFIGEMQQYEIANDHIIKII